jgi:hypothetical protein
MKGEVMAGSGTVANEIAQAFDLPISEVNKAVKACRASRLIRITGRGSSAAQMSARDAVTMITALAAFAVAAEVPDITKMLIGMPCRHLVMRGGTNLVRRLGRHHFHNLLGRPFHEGAARLFEEEWKSPEDQDGDMAFNPLDAPHALRLHIALDGRRTNGFAAIHAVATGTVSVKSYYSTIPLRLGVEEDEAPEGLGLELYPNPPEFMFSAMIDGRALARIGRALAQPVRRSRGHHEPSEA